MHRLKDKDWMIEHYIDKAMSIDEIIKLVGCGKTTAHRWMKYHGIQTRTLTEAHRLKNPNLYKIEDRDWLFDQYVTQHKTPDAISEEFGIGGTTVVRYLDKHGISIRNVSSAKLKGALPLLEDKDWLYNRYITEHKTIGDLCDELDCSSTSVIKYLDQHGIKTRSIIESISDTSKERYMNTNMIKYGVPNGAQSDSAHCKTKITNLERYGCDHHTQSHMVDAITLLEDKDWLYEKYNGMMRQTAEQISDELSISDGTVGKYLRKHNIEIISGSSVSSKEHKIRHFLDDRGVCYETSNRTIIKPLELDIFIPSVNIAIEVHGLYWHSEVHKDKNYHENKRIKCQEAGIRLIQLYEDDINNNWPLLQRFLLNAIGITNDERVFARKCFVNHNPNIQICKELLNTYHIQGYAAQNKALTLEHNGETVAVMLFKGNVLTRYATSKKVLGGFGKLLKASGLDEIITFIDLDTFSGETYFKTGFVIDSYLKPDYKYIVRGKREHKFNFRLKKFKDDPNLLYEEGKTERELALMNGLYRIYDSGKYRLIWKK